MSIIVTLQEGTKTRRYVVDERDEALFSNPRLLDATLKAHKALGDPYSRHPLAGIYFGAQWLRGPHRLDEQYRSLSGREVISVKEVSTY